MKTPDEIKKGLECCASVNAPCESCPFRTGTGAKCIRHMSECAIAYIQQLEAAQLKWISVEERLPNVGEKVMVCGVKNGMQVGAFRGISRLGKNRKWLWKKDTILEVTHWMPLPEPPKEDA